MKTAKNIKFRTPNGSTLLTIWFDRLTTLSIVKVLSLSKDKEYRSKKMAVNKTLAAKKTVYKLEVYPAKRGCQK